MDFRKWIVASVAVVAIIGILFGMYVLWTGLTPSEDDAESFSDEYELTFKTYEGSDVRLSEYRSTPLIVFTYASWCPFCADELSRLSRIKGEYGDRVAVIAVNRAEPLADAKSYTDALTDVQNITFVLDPEDAYFKSVEGYAMPETVFIKSYGKVFAQHRGPLSDTQLRKYVEDMLR